MAEKMYTIVSVETDAELTLEELCQSCHITYDFILELMNYGIIEPQGYTITTWRFNLQHLYLIRRILRLQHDLEVNLAGAVLAMDLLDQIKRLEAQVELFEKISF